MAGIQEELFELIHTLSVSEKRYFKVFAAGNKATDINYVALFDALCELDRYEESALIDKLLGKNKSSRGKKTGENLNQDMHYLYRVLLQAMRQYNHGSFAHIQIRDMICDSIFLRDRGLYKQAEKRIIKAKELSKKFHNYIALLDLNRIERTLIWSLEGTNEADKIASLISEKEHIMEVLDEEMAYEDLYAIVSNAVNRQNLFISNDERTIELVNKINALFSQKKPEQLSAFARLRRYQIGLLHKIAENQVEESHIYANQLLEWWENHPALKQEELFRYQISLTKVISFLFLNQEFEKTIGLIQRIRERNSTTANGKALIFRFIIVQELFYYLNSGNIDKAQNMLPMIEEGIRIYPLSLKRKMAIIYNAAMAAFFAEDYSYCETWLLRLIVHSDSSIREDLVRKAFLLRVILLEAKADRQEKAIRAARKYFRKSDPGSKAPKPDSKKESLETTILNLITKVMTAPPVVREKEEAVRKLLNYLNGLASNPQSRRLGGLDEFTLWCQSKLKGQSLRKVLEEASPK
ncbi:MAG: hypothetical protein HUU01_09610 [Saprospiraceae bacterium]|nr:hypothetical protein [Saprospiraceae bacterium]